jgi:hypothetical protein
MIDEQTVKLAKAVLDASEALDDIYTNLPRLEDHNELTVFLDTRVSNAHRILLRQFFTAIRVVKEYEENGLQDETKDDQ